MFRVPSPPTLSVHVEFVNPEILKIEVCGNATNPTRTQHMMLTPTRLIACFIALPSVASLAVGPSRSSSVKATMGNNNPAMCTRLESQQQAHAAAPFHEGR